MIGQVLGGRYRVEAKLGEGGMASVYRVTDAVEGRALALKLLKPGEGALDYFRHEFQVLARLDHPNLLRVYDLEASAEVGYYTCELLEGQDLFAATRDLGWDELYDVVRQVLEALGYVHDRGLVHYDVKPENLHVRAAPSPRPGVPGPRVVKLVDFGLTGEATTRRGEQIRGTLHYLAPEVAKSLPADGRADLYSFGITLYYVTTGRLPYDGGSAISILRKHIEAWPEPPSRVRPDLPDAWARFILRLIEKDPGRRYATAADALVDLARRLGKPYTAPEGGARPRAALAPRFVGREAELARLEALLGPAPGAPPRTALVAGLISGEQGVGKTRLAHELRIKAQLAGWLVVDVGARGEEPLARRLVRRALALPGGDALAREPAVAALLPGLAPPGPGAAPAAGPGDPDERRLLLDRVAAALAGAGGPRPWLLVLEDLREADEASAALVAALLRTLAFAPPSADAPPGGATPGGDGGARPVVVLTDRPAAPGSAELARALELLAERGQLARLDLGPLAAPAAAAMAASMLALPALPAALERVVAESTGGSPRFVEELVRGWVEDETVRLGEPPGDDEATLARARPPGSLEDLLGRRLARVPEAGRAVLLGLAVLDAPAPLRLLAATAGLEAEAALDALDALGAAQLVARARDPAGGAPLHRVAHGLVARAALRAAGPAGVAQAHRRAFAALAAQAGPDVQGPACDAIAERLARHADLGGEPEQARAWHRRAGLVTLARGAPHRALEHLGRALELLRWEAGALDAQARRRDEADLLTRLSEALGTVGRSRDASRALEELLAVGDDLLGPEAAVWVRRRLGDLALRRGEEAAARRWLEAALAAAGDAPGLRAERARVLEVLSRMTLWRGDYLAAITLAGEAVALFRAAGRERDTAWALHILATAEYYRGRGDRAAELLDQCLAQARGDEGWEGLLARAGVAAARRPALAAELDALGASGRPLRREAGDAHGLVLSFSELGTAVDLRADAAAAARFYDACVEGYGRLGHAQRTALCLNNRGVFRRHLGRWAEAHEDLERALAVFEGTDDRRGGAVALLNVALLREALGEAEGALERARRALALAREHGITWLTGHAHRVIGRALALTPGGAEEAERELQRAAGVFGMIGNARSLGDVLLDRAEVALRAGRPADAAALLERARGAAGAADAAVGADAAARAALLEGDLALAAEPRRAVPAYEGALRLAGAAGLVELELEARRGLAQAHAALGTVRAAQEHHEAARRLEDEAAQGLDPELRAALGRTPGAARARATTARLLERLLGDDPG